MCICQPESIQRREAINLLLCTCTFNLHTCIASYSLGQEQSAYFVVVVVTTPEVIHDGLVIWIEVEAPREEMKVDTGTAACCVSHLVCGVAVVV